jgi:hypothetical protein
LIRALRARGRSYRAIVTILRERCGLRVATHTLYHFVRARAEREVTPRRPRRPASRPVRSSSEAWSSAAPSSPDGQDDVWARIATVKQRVPTSVTEPKAFAYDENEPLQLIADVKPRRR